MPVSRWALRRAGFPGDTNVKDGFLWEHVSAGGGTHLRPFGDVIPIPAGPLREVVSAGDLLLATGAAVAFAVLVRVRDPALDSTETREEVA